MLIALGGAADDHKIKQILDHILTLINAQLKEKL